MHWSQGKRSRCESKPVLASILAARHQIETDSSMLKSCPACLVTHRARTDDVLIHLKNQVSGELAWDFRVATAQIVWKEVYTTITSQNRRGSSCWIRDRSIPLSIVTTPNRKGTWLSELRTKPESMLDSLKFASRVDLTVLTWNQRIANKKPSYHITENNQGWQHKR